MDKSVQRFGFSQTLVALAILAAFAPAHAEEYVPPSSWVGVGVGYASGDENDRARFGMFNGLREHSWYGLFDFEYITRDAAAGRWTTLAGRNLGLDTREVSFVTRQLGNWRVGAEYNEMDRFDPRTINTGLIGAGTTTPEVVRLAAPGTGQDIDLDQKRKGIRVYGSKWLNGALQFEASFKNEDKDGARVWGKGFACSAAWVSAGVCTSSTTQWALLMLPEPVDSTIQQAETKLTYTNGNLLVTGGYYGSYYRNHNGNLTPTVPGTLNNPIGQPQTLDAGLRATLALPMALWPDNNAHQFYVQGNYRFTPTTAMTFKYSYTHATQDEDFGGMGLSGAPAGRSNLGGEINTTLAQLGISSRPMPKLNLLANVRYEEKDNKTPIAAYNIEEEDLFTNTAFSPKRLNAKAEAGYLFPYEIRGVVGLDYEKFDHGTFTPTSSVAGLSGIRQKTEEWGYRVELRRSVGETLTGSIAYIYSDRDGASPWLKPLPLPRTGVVPADDSSSCVPPPAPAFNTCIYNRTGIFPFMFEDRTRDKVRVTATWQPMEKLSLQFLYDDGKDDYSGPTEHGLRDSKLRAYSVDAAYTINDAWTVSAYASRNESTIHVGHSTGYDASLEETTDAFGIGVRGRVSERFRLGGDIAYSNDNLANEQAADPLASAANVAFLASSGGLPDITYRLFRISAFGEYAIDAHSSVRVDVVHDRTKFNDWTWFYNGVPFAYSDNTTLSFQEQQNVTFLGVRYIYRWR
jgi:MtrB/PioB family decaheme-associated outer membrane protein